MVPAPVTQRYYAPQHDRVSFSKLRLKHTFHGTLNIFYRLIDYAVQPYINLFSFCGFLALLSGRTLKPIITALNAEARLLSVLIAPTPLWSILICTSSVDSFSSACLTASVEPCTSAFIIRLEVSSCPRIWLQTGYQAIPWKTPASALSASFAVPAATCRVIFHLLRHKVHRSTSGTSEKQFQQA